MGRNWVKMGWVVWRVVEMWCRGSGRGGWEGENQMDLGLDGVRGGRRERMQGYLDECRDMVWVVRVVVSFWVREDKKIPRMGRGRILIREKREKGRGRECREVEEKGRVKVVLGGLN